MKWRFIVERSPWSGGWWERPLHSVKEPLCKVLGKGLLSYQELATVLTRIEAVINSSPLTTVSDDVRDLTPITPAHLALEGALYSLPDEVSTHEGTTRRRYLYQQKLLTHFWQRWRGQYLHQLSVRYKWVCEQPALKIGDVLLISEDNVSRGKWAMGRVERLVPGKDGLVRTVTLKTQKGRLRRPVQRLHRLEVSTNQFVSDKFGDSGPSSKETPLIKSRRRWRIKQPMRKPVSSLKQYWRSWGNVRARNRSGRSSRPPVRPVLWGVITCAFRSRKKL